MNWTPVTEYNTEGPCWIVYAGQVRLAKCVPFCKGVVYTDLDEAREYPHESITLVMAANVPEPGGRGVRDRIVNRLVTKYGPDYTLQQVVHEVIEELENIDNG